ncbi:tetratricopeptide repeat protein, partial [Candidatus Latescibacterota bacterium]
MADLTSTLRTLTRNLALAATVAAMVLGGLSQVEILVFLEQAMVPVMLAAGGFWALYFMIRGFSGTKKEVRQITSSEGPGEELAQKATVGSFKLQEEYKKGSKAEAAFLRGEQEYGSFHYGEAAGHYQASVDKTATLPGYLNLGAALMNSSEFSQAEEILKLGEGLAGRKHRRDFQAAFQAGLGIVCMRVGRLDHAKEACESALSLFRSVGDGRGQADVTLTVGNLHAKRGAWDDAEKAFRSALKRYEISGSGSDLGRANACGNLGNMYMHAGKLKEALREHRRALGIHEGIGNPLGRANALSNIGNIRFRMEQVDEALKVYGQALELYRQIGVGLGEASALMNIGNVQFRQGKHAEALDKYERTLEIHTHIGNALGRANTMTNMASLLSRMERHDEALEM